MGDLKDYTEFAGPPLRLPIKGKVYEIPPVGIVDGLALAGLTTGEGATDEPAETFYRRTLSSAYEEMKADNVPGDAVLLAARVAYIDTVAGRDAAEALWNSGGQPGEAGAALAAAAKGGTGTRRRTRPAAGSTTPTPNSGTTTSPRRRKTSSK
jgi:hypothetical protein